MIKKEYCTNVTFLCGHRKGILTYGYKPSKEEIDEKKRQACAHCHMKAIYDRIDKPTDRLAARLKEGNRGH
jgi:hypothetical protein